MQRDESSETIRIVTVDDHPVFVKGVRTTIGDDARLELVGEARTVREAWRLARCARPVVMLVDVHLGADPTGIELSEALGRFYPAIGVVMLSVEDGPGYMLSAHRAGARGYVTKSDPSQRIIAAIHAVAAGGTFWPPGFRMDGRKEPWPTPTELEVMQILVEFGHNKDVAEQLGIVTSTVERHRLNLRTKLDLDTTVEMYRWLFDHGLLRSEPARSGKPRDLGARLEAELDAELDAELGRSPREGEAGGAQPPH